MEKKERPIIVPWDFTEVAENAFLHALNFSKILDRQIILLHVAAEKKELYEKESALSDACDKLGEEHGNKPEGLVVEGNIFHAIGETATERKAEMIIMGTHGIKGAQKLFGSKALKVVVSSRIPFVIVSAKPSMDKVDNILLPIDFRKENKEKANWIIYLSKMFDAHFTIYKSRVKDKGFKRKLSSNLKYIESYLKGNDVRYDVVTAPGKKSFKEEVVSHAKENEMDLILIMATRDIKFVDYVFGAPEQYIIANEHHIPVMCINPRPMKIAGGFRATGSA